MKLRGRLGLFELFCVEEIRTTWARTRRHHIRHALCVFLLVCPHGKIALNSVSQKRASRKHTPSSACVTKDVFDIISQLGRAKHPSPTYPAL